MVVQPTLAKTAKIQPYDPSAASLLKSLIPAAYDRSAATAGQIPKKLNRTIRAWLFGQHLPWQSGQLAKISTMPISPKVRSEISRQHIGEAVGPVARGPLEAQGRAEPIAVNVSHRVAREWAIFCEKLPGGSITINGGAEAVQHVRPGR